MDYLLDSNVCIGYLRGRSFPIRRRLTATPTQDVFLCAPVKAELMYGALRSATAKVNISSIETFAQPFRSLPFDDTAADHFARIRRHLESQGNIGPYDLQIAAIAIANGCALVTHNTREFSRVRGLTLEDWEL